MSFASKNFPNPLKSKTYPIVLESTTQKEAIRDFKFEALESIKVKGKSDLIQIYQPISIINENGSQNVHTARLSRTLSRKFSDSGAASSEASESISSSTVFVSFGRESELEKIEKSYSELTRGNGSIIMLEGDAGFGKCRFKKNFDLKFDFN